MYTHSNKTRLHVRVQSGMISHTHIYTHRHAHAHARTHTHTHTHSQKYTHTNTSSTQFSDILTDIKFLFILLHVGW